VIAVWKILPALALAATVAVTAQSSPFDGIWVADVPAPGGDRVKFVIQLSVDDDQLTGTLQIGDSRPIEIENGRVRGEVISFSRTLEGDDDATVQFLARVVDDGLHVGFMRRAAADAPSRSAESTVVNFTAKRMEHPRRR
jgi:hypothetical protein